MKTIIKLWAVVALTFRESIARKTFVTFFGISSLVHIFLLFAIDFDMVDASLALVKIWGKDVSVPSGFDARGMVAKILSGVTFVVFSGGIILSIFTTAGLVPTMLEKGNIELLLSKPLSRLQLFIARYVGALLIMAFNVAYLVCGVWLLLGVKTGIWYTAALYIIPMVVLAFALIYAPMALIGVLSRSTGVTVMIAFAIVFLSPLLQHTDKIYGILSSKIYYYLLNGIYHILPKTSEIGQITQTLVADKSVEAWAPFWTSCIAGMLTLTAATAVFYKKDY